jgi:hypothetical protein
MQTGVVNGWRCRYDLQTGKFDVPPLFERQCESGRAAVSGAGGQSQDRQGAWLGRVTNAARSRRRGHRMKR